jgi:predicted TIM-barrel fold metal-dependent hydrolase
MTLTDKVPIVDTDTHFTEPPDLWTSRLPKAWGDDVMHVEWDEAREAELWVVGNQVIGGVWAPLAYGRGRVADSEAARPRTRSETHEAAWDQEQRVRLMDKMGIRTAVLYPNYGGLKAAKFAHIRNGEVAIAHLRAYNDFQLEWCSNYPKRFVPMLVVPFWDVPAAISEIERMARKGFGGIVTTGAPQAHGHPYLADRRWDPLWEACVTAGLSVSFHIGSGSTNQPVTADLEAIMPRTSHLGYSSVPHMLDNGKIVLDLLLSGVLNRYPSLKFVSVESGLGWVPFVLEAADYHFKKAQRGIAATEQNDMLPSHLFRRQESDVERAVQSLSKFDTLTREKVLWRNASALYRLDMQEAAV